MIQNITTDVSLVAAFRAVDVRGDAVAVTNSQGAMTALTPLAAMEMFEQLHAARNEVRRKAGLAEIPTPDEGLLVLGFLRCVKELYERGERPNLVDFSTQFVELVKAVQMNRLDEANAETLKHYPFVTEAQLRAAPLTDEESANPWRGMNEGPTAKYPWHCPECHAANETLVWEKEPGTGNAVAACGSCGTVHGYQAWRRCTDRVNHPERGVAEALEEAKRAVLEDPERRPVPHGLTSVSASGEFIAHPPVMPSLTPEQLQVWAQPGAEGQEAAEVT